MLVQAGSGALTLGTPSSPGVPASIAANTLLVSYNDLAAAEKLFAKHGKELACFVVEPVAGNMGVVPPPPDIFRACEASARNMARCLCSMK